jgi:signal peptidase I
MRHKSLFRTILQPIAIAIVLALIVRAAVRIYSIPTASMAPTLQAGDHIVVTPYFFGATPQRGHVVVFASGDEMIVKRVIATPGELIDSRLGRPRIGGHTLAEPYVLRVASTGAIETHLIPAESYFVMGDNRDDSVDSRTWGVVPRERIVGRARLILWSSPDSASHDTASATPVAQEATRARTHRAQRLFKCIE